MKHKGKRIYFYLGKDAFMFAIEEIMEIVFVNTRYLIKELEKEEKQNGNNP